MTSLKVTLAPTKHNKQLFLATTVTGVSLRICEGTNNAPVSGERVISILSPRNVYECHQCYKYSIQSFLDIRNTDVKGTLGVITNL